MSTRESGPEALDQGWPPRIRSSSITRYAAYNTTYNTLRRTRYVSRFIRHIIHLYNGLLTWQLKSGNLEAIVLNTHSALHQSVGLTPVPSTVVKPPRCAESGVHTEAQSR
eukprot:567607-Pyramimonas_sp.AAC.2